MKQTKIATLLEEHGLMKERDMKELQENLDELTTSLKPLLSMCEVPQEVDNLKKCGSFKSLRTGEGQFPGGG